MYTPSNVQISSLYSPPHFPTLVFLFTSMCYELYDRKKVPWTDTSSLFTFDGLTSSLWQDRSSCPDQWYAELHLDRKRKQRVELTTSLHNLCFRFSLEKLLDIFFFFSWGGGGGIKISASICQLVGGRFEPSQPPRSTSGLKTSVNPSLSYSAHKSLTFFFQHQIIFYDEITWQTNELCLSWPSLSLSLCLSSSVAWAICEQEGRLFM